MDSQTELAANRLIELQEMTEKNKTIVSELESCRMKLNYTSGDIIKSSPEYVCLQSSYSTLFDDCRALRLNFILRMLDLTIKIFYYRLNRKFAF